MKVEKKRVLVVGMARSGIAAAELLLRHGAIPILSDMKQEEAFGDQLDSLLAGLNGSSEVESFTSAENTDVSAVQFALQTVAIEAPAPAAEPEAAPVALTFWQKLLKLFGLYKG